MNNTIWKYELQTQDINRIELPKGANILCVAVQANTPCIWVEVNKEETVKEVHIINTYGTGHDLPPLPNKYIGSYQLHDGYLVFHVYQYLGV